MKKNTYLFAGAILVIALIVISGVISNDSKNSTLSDTNVNTNTNIDSDTKSVVGITSIRTVSNTASAIGASSKEILWQSANYPQGSGVNINLIRKTSDSPISFELVRVLASNTPNDGSETFDFSLSENGNNLYVEVTCTSATDNPQGCSVTSEPIRVN